MSDASVILINPFEVPSGQKGFVEHWLTISDNNDLAGAMSFANLHQAIDPAARFGFVNRAEWASEDVFNTVLKGAVNRDGDSELKSKASPNLYRVVHSEGPDPSDAPVLLLNFWEVAADAALDTKAMWEKGSAKIVKAPGFMGVRFHEALQPDTSKYRWVNYAGWESEGAFQAAMGGTEAMQPPPPGVNWNDALYTIAKRVTP